MSEQHDAASAAFGIASFLRALKSSFSEETSVQVLGAAAAFQQLATLKLCEDLERPQGGVLRAGGPARKLFVVAANLKEAYSWYDLLSRNLSLVGADKLPIALLPHFGLWGNDRFLNHAGLRQQRLHAIAQLMDDSQAGVIVTTPMALLQKTLPRELYQEACLNLEVGASYDTDELLGQWQEMGYQAASVVDERGRYAVRGGIIDIFPSNSDAPLRLEFLGDELASLRKFSLSSQRSLQALPQGRIAPAAEMLLRAADFKQHYQDLYDELLQQGVGKSDLNGMMQSFGEEKNFPGLSLFTPLFQGNGCLSDYLAGAEVTLFCYPQGVERCLAAASEFMQDATTAYEQDCEMKRPGLPPTRHFAELASLQPFTERALRLEFGAFRPHSAAKTLRLGEAAGTAPALSGLRPGLASWLPALQAAIADGRHILLLSADEAQQETLAKALSKAAIPYQKVKAPLGGAWCEGDDKPRTMAGRLNLGLGELHHYHWDGERQLALISSPQLVGSVRGQAPAASRQLKNYLSSFKDLNPGELVVHVSHGIARYQGMTQIAVGGATAEYLLLSYAGGDKVYLPVDRLSLLQKYRGGEQTVGSEQLDRLDRLGGPNWQKRKGRVAKAIKDIADELLALHAKRKLAKAYIYPEAPELYHKFVDDFPYQETDDQLRAIADVEADLMASGPMDRLIVGDVGFGKTEVALRAAFRVALEGRQVLVLVPTTVLCYQHYQTFRQRFEKHGLLVAALNRFVDTKTQKDTIARLGAGKVDVVIGTHRLLSQDIKPKHLGLIIIDEEQRFGVTHKEKLKALRAQADILTLTATPIPRTLHMSMLGLKDISLLTSPPPGRRAVRTYVTRFDPQLVKEAIEQELKREGQIFFVHNRVEDIEEMAGMLKALVPNLKLQVAHGQMRENALERIIVDFMEQRFSLLLCTTIIESGVDMPNVNTLIVNRAEAFGLAQLYQLRGRVGRSDAQAYAYFLTAPSGRINEDAGKRLDVLQTHQDLGAGFKIASYDLEIRGAGNLLGGEQSGQITSVGLELYTEMLEETIGKLAGRPVEERLDTELRMPVTALIPAAYISEERDRLSLYKQIFSADLEAEIQEIAETTADRFGPPPAEFRRLLAVARLKRSLRTLRATLFIALAPGSYEVRFGPLGEDLIKRLRQASLREPASYQLTSDFKLRLFIPPLQAAADDQEELTVTTVAAMLDRMTEA